MVVFACFIIWAIFLYILVQYINNLKRNPPPGPSIISLLRQGRIYQIQTVLSNFANTFGNIFQITLGPFRVVVLSDAKIIQDLSKSIQSFQHTNDQRKLEPKHCQEIKLRESNAERWIQEEITQFLNWLESQDGTSVPLKQEVTITLTHIIWRMLTGQKCMDYDIRKILTFDKLLRSNEVTRRNPILIFPSVAQLVPGISGWDNLVKLVSEIRAEYQQLTVELDENREEEVGDVDDCVDFVDACIEEMELFIKYKFNLYKSTGRPSPSIVLLDDLLSTGIDQTSYTLGWALYYISKLVDVQVKIQEELDCMVGKNQPVTLEDRQNLPFLQATILEILRIKSIFPGGILRIEEDVKLSGYDVPKGTWIIMNHHHTNYNKKTWQDPDTFLPERFLSDGAAILESSDHLLPFWDSPGTHAGGSFARDAIFLILSNLLSRFNIINDEANVDMESAKLGVSVPLDFRFLIISRN